MPESTEPIDFFLKAPDALISLFPFIQADVSLIISAYENEARARRTVEGVLASSFGDIDERDESAEIMIAGGESYGCPGTEGETDQDLPSINDLPPLPGLENLPNPWADCFSGNPLQKLLASTHIDEINPCDMRIISCLENLPLPGFLTLFDDLIAQIKDFISKMKKLLDPRAFLEEVCLLVDALRFVCPQDMFLMVTALSFQLANLIREAIKFELDFMIVVGLILFPLFLLVYIAFDTVGMIANGPLECIFQYLDGFKEMALGVNNDAQDMMSMVQGLSDRRDREAQQNGVEAGSEEGDGGQAVDPKTNKSFSPAGKAASNQRKIRQALKRAEREGKKEAKESGGLFSGGTSEEDEEEKASRIPAGALKDKNILDEIRGSMSSFDTIMSQVWTTKSQVESFVDLWRRACQTILTLLTKVITDKMDVTIRIVEVIRSLNLLQAVQLALLNQNLCTDPSQPLTPEDIMGVLENLPEVSKGGDEDADGTDNGLVININDTGSLVVKDPILNQTFTIPTCIGTVPENLQSAVAEWIEELNTASV